MSFVERFVILRSYSGESTIGGPTVCTSIHQEFYLAEYGWSDSEKFVGLLLIELLSVVLFVPEEAREG